VAVGVLLLMLTLAGQVLSLTIRSTGQAKALSDINQVLRSIELTIREDLQNLRSDNSIILIQGNPINAYWTQGGKGADDNNKPSDGYPHVKDSEREIVTAPGLLEKPRADILMIFTSKSARSFVDPTVKSELQQVVYGHADLGKYIPDPTTGKPVFQIGPDAFPDDPTKIGPIVAENWHLSRRSVLLMPNRSPPPPPGSTVYPWLNEPAMAPVYLSDPQLLEGSKDIVANFSYARDALNATVDIDPATNDIRSNGREGPGKTGGPNKFLPPIFDPRPPSRQASRPFERSRLDPLPSATLAGRLGHYLLPHCASFKVEWTLDRYGEFVGGRLDGEKELFWFDPGADRDPAKPGDPPKPLASLKKAIDDEEARTGGSKRSQRLEELLTGSLGKQNSYPAPTPYSLSARFGGDPDWVMDDFGVGGRANTVVFGGMRRIGPLAVADEVFPGALRITIDVFDDSRRLERPIRHVMIIPLGE